MKPSGELCISNGSKERLLTTTLSVHQDGEWSFGRRHSLGSKSYAHGRGAFAARSTSLEPDRRRQPLPLPSIGISARRLWHDCTAAPGKIATRSDRRLVPDLVPLIETYEAELRDAAWLSRAPSPMMENGVQGEVEHRVGGSTIPTATR
jgi:hypothetical protein